MEKKRFRIWLISGLGIFSITLLVYAGMGYIKIPVKDVFEILFNLDPEKTGMTEWIIVREVRLPRIVVSMIAGAALSLSGLVFQGVLLNPLADPYTLGISAGASFGAALAIILKLSFLGGFTVQLMAFVFAVISLSMVLKMATFGGKINSVSLILSGVIIGAFFSAGLTFTKYIAGDEVASIVFWLMGSFSSKTWSEALIMGVITLLGFIVFIYYGEEMNILSLGEKNALSMGVDTSRVRKILLVTASIISAVSVSICGIIGFVGLIVPHLMRFLVGTDNKKLIFICALWGAIILSAADNIVRAVLPNEIPIGIMTSLLGAPFFAFIFRKKLSGGRL
jgi:iron complex transport system permease protein